MNWTDLTANWGNSIRLLKSRFPHIDEKVVQDAAQDPDSVIAHLARQHDLTDSEAREELQDWAFVQSLARQSSELRAG